MSRSYVVHASREQPLAFDEEEFAAVQWFGFDEVPFERSDPHMGRFIAKLRSAGEGGIGRRA